MATLTLSFDSGLSAKRTAPDARVQAVAEQYLRTVGGDEAYDKASNQQRLDALLKLTVHHWQLVAQHGKREVQEAAVKAQWKQELDDLQLVSPQELDQKENALTLGA